MALTAHAAGWFLLAALPISIYVAWSDLSSMKIPNVAVYALVAGYTLLGLIAFPFDQYLWHWLHLPIVLVIGIVLNAAGAMGAGDAKFIAAAAPMIGTADIRLLIPILAASVLAGYATHRIAKHTKIRDLAPHWESWDQENKRFPMGFPLGMTLVFYLVAVVVLR
ncbi:prepilin peptidase CpaA [Cognatiyoonia koreensis]|uniref:Prepilin peptidase CpaA n=1 Tax=Cognatiyoonia koreensis TaxID=364200 RepID=A0A1I0MNH9_9RHOB|nr:prepilin peptidase [Cognatiyoonia koreensis]SEV89539.1 prepilin peptidase CpaA [Cognatiyoonia koreensis]